MTLEPFVFSFLNIPVNSLNMSLRAVEFNFSRPSIFSPKSPRNSPNASPRHIFQCRLAKVRAVENPCRTGVLKLNYEIF